MTDQADRGEVEARLAELAERETAYGLLQRAQGMLKRRHYAQAAVLLERANRLEPRKGSIVEALARAYYNSGQHDRVGRQVSRPAGDRPVRGVRALRPGPGAEAPRPA